MYQALYRKWRPRSFDDVVSQPHITETLKNQIKNGRTAHAYLFTGSRGTGKTTCARIFAKAVNCTDSHDGEPCLECDICKMAENGSLGDIIEIDAASNSKVDDIRDLREGVVFTPEMSKFKVYIIDEVHMLSPGAFNALLKTMEEPPPHVKFILATTEIHKVPATIVSRCQHFDFHRIKTEDIVKRLLYIADHEEFTLDTQAAELIARLSDGGMRDALSLLDQCAALEENVTVETVSQASGIAGRDYLFDMLDKISDKDCAGALEIIDRLYDMSKDLKVLCDELLTQMRNVMLVKTIEHNKDLIRCLPEEYERLVTLAGKMKLDEILGSIRILQDCGERFARSTSKRIELEMCIIRLCSGQVSYGQTSQPQAPVATENEINALNGRISALENAIKYPSAVAGTAPSSQAAQPKPQPTRRKPDPDFANLRADNFKPAENRENAVEQINIKFPALGCFLKNSRAFVYESFMLLIVDNDFFLQKFKSCDDSKSLNDVLKNVYGKTFNIRVKSAKHAVPEDAQDPITKLLDKAQKMDIEVEIRNKIKE